MQGLRECVCILVEVTELKSEKSGKQAQLEHAGWAGALIQESISSSFSSSPQFSGMSLLVKFPLFPSNSFKDDSHMSLVLLLEYLARCSCVVVTCALLNHPLWDTERMQQAVEAVVRGTELGFRVGT